MLLSGPELSSAIVDSRPTSMAREEEEPWKELDRSCWLPSAGGISLESASGRCWSSCNSLACSPSERPAMMGRSAAVSKAASSDADIEAAFRCDEALPPPPLLQQSAAGSATAWLPLFSVLPPAKFPESARPKPSPLALLSAPRRRRAHRPCTLAGSSAPDATPLPVDSFAVAYNVPTAEVLDA